MAVSRTTKAPRRPRTTKAMNAETPRRARAEQVEPIDLHIGAMIRAARTVRNFTRQELAARLGVGQEAVEKYERGEARVLSSRLWAIARILDVPVASFFEQFDPNGPVQGSEELLKAMNIGNMQIVRDLQRLTFDQRTQIRRTIEAFLIANQQQAVGTAG